MWILIVVVVVLVAVLAVAAVRIVREYERGVVFRLGRVVGTRGPGLVLLIPFAERMRRVNLQVVTLDIPLQELITSDSVTVRVNGAAWFHVDDPEKAVVVVQDYLAAVERIARTTLLSVLRKISLDELLRNREEIGARLAQLIDELTEPWGVKVSLVELKDVELEEGMRRSMARAAEAERERRAKVIGAQGELEASVALGKAALVLEAHPAALRLRELSTLVEISEEKNSTIVFPLPTEFLRLASALGEAIDLKKAAPSHN